MLDISRITSGKFEIQTEPVNILEILQRKYNEFKDRYPSEEIKFQLESNIPLLMIDTMRFEQVLENLLSNAARYASGSQITLALRSTPEDFVLSVRDTGQGIPKTAQKLIFERFERLPGMEKTGLGLGLSIVQEIVHLHGWKITLISEPAKGAEFLISIPRQ